MGQELPVGIILLSGTIVAFGQCNSKEIERVSGAIKYLTLIVEKTNPEGKVLPEPAEIVLNGLTLSVFDLQEIHNEKC
jgi:hypothetical protein